MPDYELEMLRIEKGQLDHSSVIALLQEHLDEMHRNSPPESVHALNLDKLKQNDIHFFSAWEGDDLISIGAIKAHNDQLGEIKSMRTAIAHQRKGYSAKLLTFLIDYAKELNLQELKLETGSQPEFISARNLYEKFGFGYCEPFADYWNDPNSRFMRLKL